MGESKHILPSQIEAENSRPELTLLYGKDTAEGLMPIADNVAKMSTAFWREDRATAILGTQPDDRKIIARVRMLNRAVSGSEFLLPDQIQAAAVGPVSMRTHADKIKDQIVRYDRKQILKQPNNSNGYVWGLPGSKFFVAQYLTKLGDPMMFAVREVESHRNPEISQKTTDIGRAAMEIFLFGAGKSRFKQALGYAAIKHKETLLISRLTEYSSEEIEDIA